MQPMSQQPEPPNKFTVLMEKYTLPILIVVVGTVLSAIFLGKILIVDFNWLMLGLGCLMILVTGYYVRYSIKTREKLQAQYQKDIAAMNADRLTFKDEMRKLVTDGITRLEEWKISFAGTNAKEQKDHFEKLENKCLEAIHDAQRDLNVKVNNAESNFKGAVESERIAVELYAQQLIHAQKKMEALEEQLKKELASENKE